jgi:sugar lactone lactonase YvrE
MPAQGGAAVQLTHGSSGVDARPSPDGKWLYFSKPSAPGPIWRMPLDSNAYREEMVVGPPNHPLGGHLVATNSEVIFVDQGDETHPAGIRAYNVASKQIRTIVQTNGRALSLSHDGRMLYYAQSDRSGSNVMIANWNH